MELPHPITFDPRATNIGEAVATLPETRGIYLLSIPGNPPLLSWSINLKRRLTRLLVPSYTPRDLNFATLRQNVTAVSCWPAGSRLEVSLLMYQLTRQFYPADSLKRLRLRLPWFVALTESDPFPRLEILNRPSRKHTTAYGPFFSRDLAQRYEQEALGLFQIRRCTETLAPDPAHPGCIYGEMNQCLRPCQCAVTAEEYASETARLNDFLTTNGKAAVAALATARERASTELDFEQAAQLHKRLEKVTAAAACRDHVIANIDQFNGVALTRAVEKLQFRLWPMLHGYWQAPVTLDVSNLESESKSLDHKLRELLGASLSSVESNGRRHEQLALFSRWYYSSWRDGHWFPFRKLEDLNYRRLVREISKFAKTED